jgi:hypothetical protein
MQFTTQEYEAVRAEYRKLAKQNFTKVGSVFSKFNLYVIVPFTLILPVVGLFANIMRFLWALPLGILAFFVLSLIANATKAQKLSDEFGDDVLLKKVLKDDAIVVDPIDIRLLLVEVGDTPGTGAAAEAVNRLSLATQRYEDRVTSRYRQARRRA